MSHFTSVQTNIKDLSLLEAAAKALGLKKVEHKTVRGYAGQKTSAEIVWQVSKKYDVGVVKNANGNYDLLADWWGTDFIIPNLSKKILQEYGVQAATRRAKLLGHQVMEKELQPDGSIRLRIRC